MSTAAQVEEIARESYGRLLSIMASRTGDLTQAEDVLAEAFRAALKQWPETGLPQSPEAWLITVGNRRWNDELRRRQLHEKHETSLQFEMETQSSVQSDREIEEDFPDRRLELLFVCAHPAIDPAARTPLMLQAVLGLDAATIASAFFVDPRTMSQRLVRAKVKIRKAGIPFRLPELREWPERLEFVLEAVYAAYGTAHGDAGEAEGRIQGLAQEAIYLGRLLVRQLPREPEVLGLLALMLHCEARRGARRNGAGDFVPLAEQDVQRWDRSLIDEAERCLALAVELSKAGRFQLEAAIQSAHAERIFSGVTPYEAILDLYRHLMTLAPGLGCSVAYAGALCQSGKEKEALELLDLIPEHDVLSYQSYWAVRAHASRALGLSDQANASFQRAAGLSVDEVVRRYLLAQISDDEDRLSASCRP